MGKLVAVAVAFAGGSLIKQLVASLGVGLVAFSFLLPMVYGLIDLILINLEGLTLEVLQILQIAGVSQAMTILLSSVVARAFMLSMRKTIANEKIKDWIT